MTHQVPSWAADDPGTYLLPSFLTTQSTSVPCLLSSSLSKFPTPLPLSVSVHARSWWFVHQNKDQVSLWSVPRMKVRRFKKDLGHVLPCVSPCMGGSAMQPVHRLCMGHPGSTGPAVFGRKGRCAIPAAITDPHLHTGRLGFLFTQNPKCMALVRRCFLHDHSGIQFPPSLCTTITQGLRVLCWVLRAQLPDRGGESPGSCRFL